MKFILLTIYFLLLALTIVKISAIDQVRYIKIINDNNYLQIAQIVSNDINGNNVARGKPCAGSTPYQRESNPSKVVDGTESDRDHPNLFHSIESRGGWLEIDLLASLVINSVFIYNRRDCCSNRIIGARVQLLDESKKILWQKAIQFNQPKVSFYFCYTSCNTCTVKGFQSSHNCLTCRSGYFSKSDFKTNCYNTTPPGYYFDVSDNLFKPCPLNFISDSKNNCVLKT